MLKPKDLDDLAVAMGYAVTDEERAGVADRWAKAARKAGYLEGLKAACKRCVGFADMFEGDTLKLEVKVANRIERAIRRLIDEAKAATEGGSNGI